jgi:hypothetical protein
LECSTNARLLFIGLWNFCDDAGRHPLRPKQIKAQIFPGDEFTSENILGMIRELSANGLITLYSVDSDEFIQVNGWEHQRIDKPQPARYPAPEEGHSTNVPGTFPPDRIGEDSNYICPSVDGPADRTPIQQIVGLYHEHCPSLPRVAKLTPARRQAIRARWRNELTSLEDWADYFAVVERSDFLAGRAAPTGGRSKPFVADFDFLTKQANVVKVMEGKYDD